MKALIFRNFSCFAASIILFGQVVFVENVKLVLKKDNTYTNSEMLTLECEIYGFQNAEITQVTFVNMDALEEVQDDRSNGIGIYGNSLIFTFGKINDTALDGKYQCQITNHPIPAVSNSFNFRIQDYVKLNRTYLTSTTTENPEAVKPKLTVTVIDWCTLNDIKVKDKCHLFCDVKPKDFKIIEYVWFHNGVVVQTDYSTDLFVLGDKGSELAFSDIQKSHDGEYYCYGSTEKIGVLQSNRVTMIVDDTPEAALSRKKEKPKLILKLADLNSPENITMDSPLGFNCTVEVKNITINRYRWFQDGKEIFNASDYGIQMLNNGSLLRFSRAKIFHTGSYTCHAETFQGLLRSDSLQIRVKYPPPTPSTTTEGPSTTPRMHYDVYNAVTVRPLQPAILRLENGLKPRDIQQYDHVEFICELRPAYQIYNITGVIFYCNQMPIYENITAGIILNGSRLIMERIDIDFIGIHRCEFITDLSNVTLESNLLGIKIKRTFALKTNTSKVHIELGKEFEKNNIKEWDNVYFNCTFRDNMTNVREISWGHNYNRIVPSKEADIVHGGSILVLPRIQKASSGRYYCVVETLEGEGYRSNMIKIDVQDTLFHLSSSRPLLIADMNYDPTLIEEGEDVQITCKIYADDATTLKEISWFLNYHRLDPWNDHRRTNPQELHLLIDRIDQRFIGRYYCKDVNIHDAINLPLVLPGIRNKSEPHVHISRRKYTGRPKIRARIATLYEEVKIYLETTQTEYLVCDTPDTSNIRQIRWFRNEQEIFPNKNYDLLYGNYTLVIIGMEEELIGSYYCQAEMIKGGTFVESNHLTINELGHEFFLPFLNVTLVVELLADPDLVLEGEEIYLFCNIYPNSVKLIDPVVWFHNDVIMDQSEGSVKFERQTLKFNYIRRANSGNYSCQITNSWDNDTSTTSQSLQLVVKDRIPGFHPQNRTNVTVHTLNSSQAVEGSIREGDKVTLICDVEPKTTKVFHYDWILENQVIRQKDVKFTFEKRNRTLVFEKIEKSAKGNYRCSANSKRGALISGFFALKIKEKPKIEYKIPPSSRFG